MKIIVILTLVSFSLFGTTCYTAVNGFVSAVGIASKIQAKSVSTRMKVGEFHDTVSDKESKLKDIAILEEQIRRARSVSYLKSKSILAYLKTKNTLESNSMSIEQIAKEREHKK